LAQGWSTIVTYRIIEREAVRVAYTRSIGDPSSSNAFQRLEQVVPLKGNRFFATFDSLTQEYCACVALEAGQSGACYGLPEGVLPGGAYASTKLVGPFATIVTLIAPTFAKMRRQHGRDATRLPIEYYKRSTEIVLYLPVSS